MNRFFGIVFLIVALGLAIYNVLHIDPNNLFEGDSLVACIGVMASLCAIVVLLIFWTSKRIQNELRKK